MPPTYTVTWTTIDRNRDRLIDYAETESATAPY